MSDSVEKQQQSLEDFYKKNDITKESYSVNGVTAEFIWYETDRIMREMEAVKSRVGHLSKVMEGHRENHMKIIDDLLTENKKLREKLKEQK